MRTLLWLTSLGLLWVTSLAGAGREFTVLTYNVENLFDADQVAVYDDYKEVGNRSPFPYTPAMLAYKVETVSRVLAAAVPGGPDIIVFSEFEEDRTPDSTVGDMQAALAAEAGLTVAQLLAEPHLERMRGYPVEFFVLKQLRDDGLGDYHVAQALWADGDLSQGSVHKNVIFSRFPFNDVRWHPLEQARAIVEADIDIDGHSFVVFANHWKAGASNPQMELIRQGNARVLRARVDALLAANPRRDLLLAGDFNSAYEQAMFLGDFHPNAVNHILGSQGDERKVAEGKASLYNLWFDLPRGERRSDLFRGRWGTLMQKMISPGLYDHRGIQYVRKSFSVVSIPGLTAYDNGLLTPRRWSFFGGGSGVSDHFPLLARFRVAPADQQSDAIVELTNPGRQEDTELEPTPVRYDRIAVAGLPLAADALANLDEPALGAAIGNFYRVAGKVVRTRPFQIEVAGRTYDVWSYDPEVTERLQQWRVGRRVRIAGELDEFRGRLQFVIHRTDWASLPAWPE